MMKLKKNQKSNHLIKKDKASKIMQNKVYQTLKSVGISLKMEANLNRWLMVSLTST
jgi:hypothetical protein